MVFQEVKNNKMYKMMIMGQIRLEQRNEQWSQLLDVIVDFDNCQFKRAMWMKSKRG